MQEVTGRAVSSPFSLIKPLFVGLVAAFAAVTSAGIAGWGVAGELVLATIAWIDGLVLTAYLQTRSDPTT